MYETTMRDNMGFSKIRLQHCNHGASPQVIRQKGLTTNLRWQRISISGEMGGWFTRSMESFFSLRFDGSMQ
jgi:hypothetical protein